MWRQRKICRPEFLKSTFNQLPEPAKNEVGVFLYHVTMNPYSAEVMNPAVTKLNGRAQCETVMPSGYRVLWSVDSAPNEECIIVYDILPPS
jgi:hypothetical protein